MAVSAKGAFTGEVYSQSGERETGLVRKLAVNGGEPVRKAPFPRWPVYSEREIESVTDVIRSRKWWRCAYSRDELGEGGPERKSKVEQFEETLVRRERSVPIACLEGEHSLLPYDQESSLREWEQEDRINYGACVCVWQQQMAQS